MDEQMISKRSEQYTKTVQIGERIGKRLNRLAGLLAYAKTPVAVPARARAA
jgi:hypothetical protein